MHELVLFCDKIYNQLLLTSLKDLLQVQKIFLNHFMTVAF